MRQPCLEPLQGPAQERHTLQQHDPLILKPAHAIESQPTWIAEDEELKRALRAPVSSTVPKPSREARPPQSRQSRIKRWLSSALALRSSGSLEKSARRTNTKSLVQQRSPTMLPIISLPAEAFSRGRRISSVPEGRSAERSAKPRQPTTH